MDLLSICRWMASSLGPMSTRTVFLEKEVSASTAGWTTQLIARSWMTPSPLLGLLSPADACYLLTYSTYYLLSLLLACHKACT
jgi:hypothetical protein